MGWQSDWIYQLIFKEVALIWREAQKDGLSRFGPGPERFYIREHAGADWKEIYCLEPTTRIWIYDGSGVARIVSGPPWPTPDHTVRGMFYRDGTIRFHITDDRKRILWNHVLGKRYGRGRTFHVRGQGQNAYLERELGTEWVS